ncbi:MAG: LysM peptidoglycan-binding domain-containing protein [Methylotenera sp.]|nr:LysM peptidoglycan-binding domain-containing protein [Methylotenera sp.]MDO9388589.1 LysM peptidoglycan-binding domain-containing protein [Methylotenera sp.]MDP1597364.1 LysM peptidoglycan-binding domain-containing protein [Methylotenera sp.]MDP1754654.1 LysM peptidoglycan-binding domain-containing protein [Methylotenera sp.]MDP1960259.1 LysM peptidoglycan-binding domain-containing protein [Methylotenera sp.]
MFRNIITLLMFCCLSFHLNAQEVALKPNHPDRHVVVKGDTLWGISGKFLKDPWLWPKVWQLNRAQIKNPHLIYPGDVVFLDMSSGKPELKLLRETITLQPGTVIEPLDKTAISTIPLNVIAPFLSQPLVIEKDQLAESPRIIAGQDNRVVLSPGTRVYINKIEEGDGLNWFVYRPGNDLIDPDSKEVLGVEATYLGDASVTKYGEPASANITKAKEEIFTKDRLVPSGDEVITNFVPRAPDSEITGRIIKIYGGVAEAGPQSIVSISRGSADGIEVGHVLAISRYGRVIKDPEPQRESDEQKQAKANTKPKLKELNFEVSRDADGKPVVNFEKKPENTDELALEPGMIKLPDERVGLLMVFRVFDRVSYGLIMQASEPVNTLDSVKTP